MVLLVYVGDDVVVLHMSLQQLLLLLHWQPYLPILEVELGDLLVVYDVVGVADGAQLPRHLLLVVLLVGVQVDDIEVFLIFRCLLLDRAVLTRWCMRDLALFYSVSRLMRA